MESLEQVISRQSDKGQVRWQPLEDGTMKLNVDSSYDANIKVARLGAVIRDRVGEGWCSTHTKKVQVSNPLCAEVMAICMGMELAAEFSLRRLVVESDSYWLSMKIKSKVTLFGMELD
ncbi:hypothetical protein REPUB_Repub20aG0008200 [Reevesia pubescens]